MAVQASRRACAQLRPPPDYVPVDAPLPSETHKILYSDKVVACVLPLRCRGHARRRWRSSEWESHPATCCEPRATQPSRRMRAPCCPCTPGAQLPVIPGTTHGGQYAQSCPHCVLVGTQACSPQLVARPRCSPCLYRYPYHAPHHTSQPAGRARARDHIHVAGDHSERASDQGGARAACK